MPWKLMTESTIFFFNAALFDGDEAIAIDIANEIIRVTNLLHLLSWMRVVRAWWIGIMLIQVT